ncbi:MAG: DUF6259 domain-containing protein [Planctomycetota bacterium]
MLRLACAVSPAAAAPSTVQRVSDAVVMVRDDAGNWGGTTRGITHQAAPDYQAKKVLDLAGVPEGFWDAATEVRLSIFLCVRDYSKHAKGKSNGLDEAIEVVVNRTVHRIPTDAGLPAWSDGKSPASFFRWHDIPIPKDELVRGANEIILRKAPTEGKGPDDYLYLGIDNTVAGGKSWVQFGKGAPWRQDKLTVPGGAGEYMVRLYLLRGERGFQATWDARENRFDDPASVMQYAGSHGGPLRVEWDAERLDRLGTVSVTVETDGAAATRLQWLDERKEPVGAPAKRQGPRFEATLAAPLSLRPGGIQLDQGFPLKALTLRASGSYHPLPRRIDMAPRIGPPRGPVATLRPSCVIEGRTVTLENDNLRCRWERVEGRLRLVSLHNRFAKAEMVRRPRDCALFLIETGGERLAGSRDFACERVTRLEAKEGFRATFAHRGTGLRAALSVWLDLGLRMALRVTNGGEKRVHFKVAFPHLSGLVLSEDPRDDYYFFPWGGGIIADAPALIRRGYGDHEAIYQVMDLFSPKRGAGLAVWTTDADGRYKTLALRKHIPGQPEINGDRTGPRTAREFLWTNSLPQVPGIGIAYEYLRRTRKPGQSFAPKPVVLRAHPGDWHAAMRMYAAWCRRVWDFRPYPNRLTPVVNMVAAGWGQSPLYAREGQPRVSEDCGYRTDFLRPRSDCIELMSWWEWQALGPWGIPIGQVEAILGEAKAKRWASYFVKDPATGKVMFSNQPGDYDGYNRRWGGLPALRQAIAHYHKAGKLVTLYTDPIRCDFSTETGKTFGRLWGVVEPDGDYVDSYDVWNMCHDVAEYREWVAKTMKRVLRETGADGIRLDEYGHKGWACFSGRHDHTFAEPGCTEWQRAIAETTRLVRQAMDEVAPRSVLTTEHPGYDFLLQFIEGCITYDVTVQATPLRPLEVNTQRFYFPECKPFELDHRGGDPGHHKRLWNGVASFGSRHPEPYDRILRENADAFASRDCTALLPTLARRVYANRFRAKDKTLYTLYNATGHSFAGPAVRMDIGAEEHVFDLLGCKEADFRIRGGYAEVDLFLPPGQIGCLVRVRRELGVSRRGDVLRASARGGPKSRRICVCDRDGQPLLTQPRREFFNEFDLAALPAAAPPPACVKLLDAGRLVDVVAVPR